MCGICGFTGAREGSSLDRETLKAMCDIIAHRGPDGEGQYIDDGIALGHRRLSLIDLEGGHQPMVRSTGQHEAEVTSPALGADGNPLEGEAKAAQRGDWAIVFNGEIYNYRELREQLMAEGWQFQTKSDTEVLLVGYIAWSEEVLQKLRGMFAFAIWNRSTRELFCARDFFGIKPFYYTVVDNPNGGNLPPDSNSEAAGAQQGCNPHNAGIQQEADPNAAGPQREPAAAAADGVSASNGSATRSNTAPAPMRQFIFASETKSILEHPAYERKLNEEALGAYLCYQFSALHQTFFEGIFKLPQGHSLRVLPDGSLEIKRYWQPAYHFDGDRSLADTVQAIDDAMRESVRYHNVADVEVGSFLSSGIDSSYMAACLAQENPAIKTFTVGFSEYSGEKDEVSWASELADLLNISNTSKHITEAEYWESLPRVQWHMDEPSADPSAVALYFVDQLAAQQVKAVLSGEGADEFFGGYRIYQAPFSNAKLGWAPKGVLAAGSKVLRKLGIRGANYLERASETAEDWYYTNANGVAFSPEERERILAPDLRERLKTTATPGGAAEAIGLAPHGATAAGNQPASNTAAAAAKRTANTAASRNQQHPLSHLPKPQRLTAPIYAEVAQLDETTRMQYVDLWFWLVGDILLKTDKMSMAHSLESRVPFLDKAVFELSATIPTPQKVDTNQTKIALRQAAERAIPPEWAQKEKLGFPVPVSAWLKEDRYCNLVKQEFESAEAARFFNTDQLVALLDEHRAGTRDNTRRIWIIYMFLMWYRIYFIDQKKPA